LLHDGDRIEMSELTAELEKPLKTKGGITLAPPNEKCVAALSAKVFP
jgi:hypothetical protein